MGRLQFPCRALLIREHGRQSVYRLRLPAPELIGMNTMFGRNLRESLFFLEYFQHELDLVRGLDDIPEIPLPAGFEIRPVVPGHYEAIRLANIDAWKDSWDFSEAEWDEEHFEMFKRRSWFQPDLWVVAWKGDMLAGMVLNYIVDDENRQLGVKRGHNEFVYVREQFRGLGLARALLSRSLKVVKDRGMDEAILSAEIENPHDALKLYEGMGFRIVNHFTWYHKPIA